jgi:peptidoglycan hydrolase-like protein with peptidoglycan-binding domain
VTGSPPLRQGSTGWQVKALQSALNAHGASLLVDGAFGPRTHRAVVSFQQRNGLVVDGVVGPQTAGALNRGDASPSPAGPEDGPSPVAPTVSGVPALSFGSRGGLVSALQRALNQKGASVGVDGVFGAQTHSAVRSFQAANGLLVDGVVGPMTAGRLNDPTSRPISARPGGGQGERPGGGSGNGGQYGSDRASILEAAASHLGAPYYWGADGPSMFDCSGFVLYVLRQDTGLVNWGDDTAQGIKNRVPRTTNPQPGDLVFYSSGGHVQHIEMVVEGSTEIGASGGGSRTYGDNPRAKVQYGNMNDDSRSRSYGSIEQLIAQKARRA